ncbi:GNAT family N-acetyltransferase [Butyrivibrio sp. AE3006]|uniref:GNAT family N-acetyltransferase n=1 Tax=Butyrivibrio sp. AE3006 TaxID=1280673 RepID=UPI0003F8C83A|nr:GNAT family N-acetyltransferase [Butyrivibrio sp. AE3006]
MITELADKNCTRKLYEEAFDDPKEFVDYYYADKCSDNRIIADVEDGEVVSMLHLNPYRISLDGSDFQSYYVVAVATAENRRREGKMAKVFEKTLELLKNENIPLIFLMPVDEAIYSWMGFEKICDFALDKISSYEGIRKNFDMYCIRDDVYIRRMQKEDAFREQDNGEVLPDNPVIMAKITDLEAFNSLTGQSFLDEKEALLWLKNKKIYICEEV